MQNRGKGLTCDQNLRKRDVKIKYTVNARAIQIRRQRLDTYAKERHRT